MSLLKVENLHTYYGRVHALKGINLEVEEGQIVTLIGANGAGKSTTLRTISGLLRPREGGITFKGEPIHELASHRIVERGICHSPEGRGILSTLTVDENLNMGAYVLGSDKEAIEANRRRVFDLFPRMEERRNQLGGTLSGGEQQMLTIARALMGRPKLMLIDEPSEGLAPKIVHEIMEIIKQLQKDGRTIMLVEQHMEIAMRLSDNQRAYIMEKGQIRMCGTLDELSCRMDEVVQCLGVKV